jgi:hypothetical protein
VPKRENFDHGFFTLSDPFWVGDLGTEANYGFFYHFGPDFLKMDFGFLPHAKCLEKKI